MTISWRLKNYLAVHHQIYSVTEFQKLIVKKTGVKISLTNLCKYVNDRPKLMRTETVEILCSALECNLNKFLSISPKKMDPGKKRKLSYKNTPRSKVAVKEFPGPEDYGDRW